MEILKGKRYIFRTTNRDLKRYNGTRVYIEFPLLEIGVETNPTMYRARFFNGRYYDVFEHELSVDKMKYRVTHYDHFYNTSNALRACYFFETLEEAEKFIDDWGEAKKKWPGSFDKHEYVLEEIKDSDFKR